MPVAQKPTAKSRALRISSASIIAIARAYQQLMPAKKSHHIAVWVAFFVVSAIIAGQMLYPLDRAVPFAMVGDTRVGLRSHDDMAQLLNERFLDTKIRLVAGTKSSEYTLKSAGAELDTERIIFRLTEYPFWQRFIPFSLLWQLPRASEADVYYTDIVLRQFSEQTGKSLSFGPTNARLAIENGVLKATSEIAGSNVTSEAVYMAVSKTRPGLGVTTDVEVASQRLLAEHPMKEFIAVKQRAEAALKRQVTVRAGERNFVPSRETMASWLMLDTGKDGKVTLRVDNERIGSYIDSINKETGVPAGRTDITMTDGRETGRVTGSAGRAVDKDALTNELASFLLDGKGQPVLVAKFVDVPPTIMFNSKYTSSQEGLQAYLADLGKSKDVRVSVRQLDGGKWQAATREHESIPSGSTYKLFVALKLFDEMKQGKVHWEDPMLDTTVSTCFDRMTIASTNPCAEKWLANWGRQNVNNFVYDHGFSTGTSFTNPVATHSTAADLTQYMIGLRDGSLVGEPYRSRLLHSLSVHPYRYGIPTGSKGRVWDKVGFLWDYIHDTAIVEHPRGTYVMTIMTKGQSYGAIANIAREVERIMYP